MFPGILIAEDLIYKSSVSKKILDDSNSYINDVDDASDSDANYTNANTDDAIDSDELSGQAPERPAMRPGANSSVLLYDGPPGPQPPESDEHEFHTLYLPAGPASLVTQGPDCAAVVEVEPSDAGAHSAIFENALSAAGERLLMFTRPGGRARVNGLPVPIVVSLSLGDQLSLDSEQLFHVSRLNQTAPVAVPTRLIGKRCEVCLLPFTEGAPVVLCASCGAARHMEGEDVSPEARLECAAIGTACPNCESESPQADGLAYVPED
jgi:hypothetical protein